MSVAVIMLIENHFHLTIQMKLIKKEIVAKLRQRGYKLTPQRKAVVKAIATSHEHLTPAAIYERVQPEHPGIGLVTIYRTLEILTKLKVICEVNAEGSPRSYLIRRASGHHHHLICSGCGTVVAFNACDPEELEQRLSQKTGFKIENHFLEFIGLCRECQQTASA